MARTPKVTMIVDEAGEGILEIHVDCGAVQDTDFIDPFFQNVLDNSGLAPFRPGRTAERAWVILLTIPNGRSAVDALVAVRSAVVYWLPMLGAELGMYKWRDGTVISL